MALSNDKKKEHIKRLLLSRMRILVNQGFYGLLLMHMQFAIDENCETAATDGRRIYFGPDFLDALGDDELDFVMMHEILHVVLRHSLREGERDHERFNIACDIVVNSTILQSCGNDLNAITLQQFGPAIHETPNKDEGYKYTAEQVYEMLGRLKINGRNWDDHSKWGTDSDPEELGDLWVKRFEDACEAIRIRDVANERGLLPLFAQRMFKELHEPQLDWRLILNEFVQEEVVDYSFTPPDRRYLDSPFFLPDFNEYGKGNQVENILFMIDTSASMSDDMITAAYSEIKGAIDQYGGALRGWLGFFDAGVVEPKPFESEDEFRIIQPAGGGGTSFRVIFEYVKNYMQENLPVSIIILTDGYAPFPEEKEAMGIPVLWLINNDTVNPPWGKKGRFFCHEERPMSGGIVSDVGKS